MLSLPAACRMTFDESGPDADLKVISRTACDYKVDPERNVREIAKSSA